jgi:hypothetical protein
LVVSDVGTTHTTYGSIQGLRIALSGPEAVR